MADTEPEFSRAVALEELRGGLVRRDIEAKADERRRLAARFDLQAIDGLTATVSLEARNKGRIVVARGRFTAAVTQTCVVSLEPLPRTLSEDFTVRMIAEPDPEDTAIIDVDPTVEDEPEPIEGDSVDVGELVAQHLSLALDPYPRAEGAELEQHAVSAGDAASDGPFAKLSVLKSKGGQ